MSKRPTTQKEAINQLWDDIRGVNGEGLVTRVEGLAERFDEHVLYSRDRDIAIEKRLGEISGDALIAAERSKDIKDRLDKYPSKRTMWFKDFGKPILQILATVAVLAGIVAFFLGKLTPDDITNILEAYRG